VQKNDLIINCKYLHQKEEREQGSKLLIKIISKKRRSRKKDGEKKERWIPRVIHIKCWNVSKNNTMKIYGTPAQLI